MLKPEDFHQKNPPGRLQAEEAALPATIEREKSDASVEHNSRTALQPTVLQLAISQIFLRERGWLIAIRTKGRYRAPQPFERLIEMVHRQKSKTCTRPA